MDFNALIYAGIDMLVTLAKSFHFPLMVLAFVFGVCLRALVYYTVQRHEWFAREFEKRVNRHISEESAGEGSTSFYVVTKKLLERTFYETFENRDKYRRRRHDKVMLLSDRIFLIKSGCAWLVHDILKQIKFLKYGAQPPKLLNITKNTFSKNPCFNKIFGIIPSSSTNEVLNILPGLFVIGGIFGTFLGVAKGLPELSGMSLNDPEKTKAIMDRFLVEISLSMGASILGIFFSVLMTIVNTLISPDRKFVEIVDRFENSLDLLWNLANVNEVPKNLEPFDENRDPMEALAEASLNQELGKKKYNREAELNETTKNAS